MPLVQPRQKDRQWPKASMQIPGRSHLASGPTYGPLILLPVCRSQHWPHPASGPPHGPCVLLAMTQSWQSSKATQKIRKQLWQQPVTLRELFSPAWRPGSRSTTRTRGSHAGPTRQSAVSQVLLTSRAATPAGLG